MDSKTTDSERENLTELSNESLISLTLIEYAKFYKHETDEPDAFERPKKEILRRLEANDNFNNLRE